MRIKKKRRRVVLDAYRADVSRALAKILGLAAVLVLLGSFASGSALVAARLEGVPVFVGRRAHMVDGALRDEGPTPSPSGVPILLGLVGVILIVGGAGTAILGLRHVLAEERYLLLRRDGALFVRGAQRVLLRWSDVEQVTHEDGLLVLTRHDGTAVTVDEKYGGVSTAELVKRVAQLRRRALFGLTR